MEENYYPNQTKRNASADAAAPELGPIRFESRGHHTRRYAEKNGFNRPFQNVLTAATALTGLTAILGALAFLALPQMIVRGEWLVLIQMLYGFGLFWMCDVLCFISCIILNIRKRPFSTVLYRCMAGIAVLTLLNAVTRWAVPGAHSTGFEILSYKEFYLDGTYLTVGLVILLFSMLVKYGLAYQRNEDMTI